MKIKILISNRKIREIREEKKYVLKKHLCFIGKPKQKEISFHNIDSLDKDLIIEVDDFTKIWSYLNLLADSKNENLIEEWKKKNNIDKTEFDEMNQFLIENGMVYED